MMALRGAGVVKAEIISNKPDKLLLNTPKPHTLGCSEGP